MLSAALLRNLEEAGTAVAILSDSVEEQELGASRLTRAEVERQLLVMAQSLADLGPAVAVEMPEIDGAGWRLLADALAPGGTRAWETVWFAVESLVPATLLWLRVYRNSRPEWFEFRV